MKSEKEKPVGLSRSHLKYSGNLIEFGFKLACEPEFEDCWGNKMEFKKIYN